ncbi:hypothetical protein QAD02_000383, partial [Eretmocerus hayati]
MWSYLLASLLVTIGSILIGCSINSTPSIVEKPEPRYDYIIVGAGTAGCVLASRLSEDVNVSVLLVEAGGHFSWLASVPLAAPALQMTEVDWSFKTEPQLYSTQGMYGRQQYIPRGKGLGGSGELNYQLHSFGRAEDFSGADWPSDLGWSRADMRPYFERALNAIKPWALVPDPEETPLAQAMLDARQQIGRHLRPIFSMPRNTMNKDGTRWSSYRAYLQPALTRPNLHVLINTIASRVLLDSNNTTEGVEVRYEDGTREKVEASREVILCAGAIGTPHLLLVSGIGPAAELALHKITVARDLPAVGKNYADHVNMPVYVTLTEPASITVDKVETLSTVLEYFVYGTGFLATNGIMGTARVGDSLVFLAAVGSADEKLLRDLSNYRPETFRNLFPTYNDTAGEGFILMSSCLQPKSRGRVSLRSANILDPPIVDPAFLRRYEDVACIAKAMRLGMSIAETTAFRSLGARLHLPKLAECEALVRDYRNDDFAECVMRSGALTGHHPCGTCRIAGSPDQGVVDHEL